MDLAEITDFIALDNPQRAWQFEDELLEHAQKIQAVRRSRISASSWVAVAVVGISLSHACGPEQEYAPAPQTPESAEELPCNH